MQNPVVSPTPHVPSSQPVYFGGDSIFGDVHPLTPTSFNGLFLAFYHSPIRIRPSRAELNAMCKKDRDAVKRQKFVCAGSLDSAGPRKREKVVSCPLVILDIDDSSHAAPLLDGQAVTRLIPFNFILYRTLSSTPEAPRLRLLVDVEPFPPDDYEKAVRYLCAKLGIIPNSETIRCHQPMYLPTACTDDPNPLVAFATTRPRMLHREFVDYEIPTPTKEAQFVPVVSDVDQVLDLDTSAIRGMLEHLDPDESYDLWVRVMCALRHQFGQGDAAYDEEGFELFDDWSRKGTKYDSPDSIRSKWASFRPSPNSTSAPITLRTIIKRATAAGWKQNGVPTQKGMMDLRREILEETDSAALIASHPHRIASAGGLTSLEVDTLIGAIAARSTILGVKVTASNVRKAVNQARRQIDAEASDDNDEDRVPSWAVGWAFLAPENKFVHMDTLDPSDQTSYVVDGFNGKFVTEIPPDADGRAIRPSDLVLRMPAFPKIDGFRYYPGRPDEKIILDGQRTYINSYKASPVDADPGTSAEAGKIIEYHTKVNFPDRLSQQMLLSFLAFIVQQPGRKIKYAVFMQGAEGSGKGIFMDMMGAVLGKTNYVAVGDDAISSPFNEWMADKQLIFYDEVLQGNMKQDRMNSLKAKITNEEVSISQKFKNVRTVPNLANDFFASNSANGIRIDDNDRRFFVLQSVFQTKRDIDAFKASNPDHFTQMFRLKDDLAGGARHFLLNYSLHPDFNPNGVAPVTAARSTVVSAGRTDMEFAIQNIIDEGDTHCVYGDMIAFTPLMAELRHSHERNATVAGITRGLTRMGFTKHGQVRVGENHRQTMWLHETWDGSDPGDKLRERLMLKEAIGDIDDLL